MKPSRPHILSIKAFAGPYDSLIRPNNSRNLGSALIGDNVTMGHLLQKASHDIMLFVGLLDPLVALIPVPQQVVGSAYSPGLAYPLYLPDSMFLSISRVLSSEPTNPWTMASIAWKYASSEMAMAASISFTASSFLCSVALTNARPTRALANFG